MLALQLHHSTSHLISHNLISLLHTTPSPLSHANIYTFHFKLEEYLPRADSNSAATVTLVATGVQLRLSNSVEPHSQSAVPGNEIMLHYKETVTSLQSLYNKKWLEMPVKIKTSSFMRYSEAKITLLALYMLVVKSPKLLK